MTPQHSLIRMEPGGEPFLLHRGRRGVLLLHGFTATPFEVRWLGEHLAGAGFSVYAPRLPGHSAHPHDLARMHWPDWLAAVHDAWHVLRGLCDEIVIVGHSMGGLLGLLASLDLSCAGVGVLASPIYLTGQARLARWLRYIVPYTDQPDKTGLDALVRMEQRRRGEPEYGRVRQDTWSTAAVAQLADLVAYTETRLPDIQTPLLLVYAKNDRTVSYDQMSVIAGRVGSRDVTQRTLERGGHIVTLDADRDATFGWVLEFVEKVLVQR